MTGPGRAVNLEPLTVLVIDDDPPIVNGLQPSFSKARATTSRSRATGVPRSTNFAAACARL